MGFLENFFLCDDSGAFIMKGELLREENKTYSSNRNVKDSVFRLLFDDEANLLSLFNALEGKDYKDKEVIEINTLKGAIFNKVKNDLSFSVEELYLNLIEHQSTISENSPLRSYLYLGQVYRQILDVSKVYQRKLYKIPTPRLYVLYNGVEDFPLEKVQRFSNAFLVEQGQPMVQQIVKTININWEKGHPILKECKVLGEYSLFIDKIRQKLKKGMNRDLAVKEAVLECLEEGVLKEFLTRHGKEVYGMDFFNITYEELLKIRVDEAREDGLEEGTERGIASLVLDYCEEGFSKEKILGKLERRFDLSRDQAKAYYEQYAQ